MNRIAAALGALLAPVLAIGLMLALAYGLVYHPKITVITTAVLGVVCLWIGNRYDKETPYRDR